MVWGQKLFGHGHGHGRREGDRLLMAAIGLVAVFGLIMLASASSVVAYNTYQDSYYFLKHQLFNFLLGGAAFWFFSRFDYRRWQAMGLALLVGSIILLLLVFVPALALGSRAHSWINVFGFSLQPSEFVKLSFLIYLSALFAGSRSGAADKTVPFIIVYVIIALLMLAQPDLGTLIIITTIALTVYFISGGRGKYIASFIGVGLVVLAVLVSLNEYQQNRFRCLINPAYSPQKYCYQINQSLIAIGSGGAWGRGLGGSRQKFLYLPEVQNDFIFSIIAEETGWLISVLLVTAYGFIFWRGYLIAKRSTDDFGRNLSIGIVTWVAVQAIINIGGITNFLPMTGVPLPLISYGGSAVLSNLAALGMLINISKSRNI